MSYINNKFWIDFLQKNASNFFLKEFTSRSLGDNKEVFELNFKSELNEKLLAIADDNDFKIMIVFLSVYMVLFKRYNAGENVVFNLRIDDDILGYKAMPLYITLDEIEDNEANNFTHILKRVQTELKRILNFGHYDLNNVSDKLKKQNSNNLEEITCGFHYLKDNKKQVVASNLLFDFGIIKHQNSYSIKVVFDSLIDKEFVSSFSENFVSVSSQIVDSMQIQLSEMNYCTDSDLELINKVNNDAVSIEQLDLDSNLIYFFNKNVSKFPLREAIRHRDRVWTYQTLNEKSNIVSTNLEITYQLTKGDIVGVYLDTSPEFVGIILALLKIGARILLLEKSYQDSRIEFYLNDAKAKYLIAEEVHNNRFNLNLNHIPFKSLFEESHTEKKQPLSKAKVIDAHTPAFIFYTSGSSGQPRGISLIHENLVNQLIWFKEYFDFSPEDVLPQKASLSFIDCLTELLFPITLGSSTIYLRPKDSINKDILAIAKWLDQIEVSILLIVPSIAKRIDEVFSFDKISSLKHLVLGGEILNFHFNYDFEIYNLYGCTECSSISTIYKIDASQLYDSYPIGNSIYNVKLHILDKHLNHLPVNAVGELYIEGISICDGYINENVDSNSFIDSPFKEGEKLYKTGDYARLTNLGEVYIIGRKDDQIKIRGIRIDLSEIDNLILSSFKTVKHVLSVYHQHPIEGVSVYFSGENIERKDIDDKIVKNLGNVHVPYKYIYVDEFNFTSSGKVDKYYYKSNVENDIVKLYATHVEPQKEIEKKVAQIWSRILKKNEIGLDDNFFELGGDSILSSRIIYEVYKNFNIELTINSIYEYSTLKDFSSYIEGFSKRKETELVRIDIKPYYQLSYTQERLWFMHNLFLKDNIYNMVSLIKLNDPLNEVILSKTIQHIINKYEVLRTNFRIINDQVQQVINENVQFKLEKKTSASVQEINGKELSSSFNLERDLLIRGSIYSTETNEEYLVLCIHHIIFDNWSSRILFKELVATYQAFKNGIDIKQKDLPIHYKDFAEWERKRFNSKDYDDKFNFWVNKFKSLPERIKLPYKEEIVQNSLKLLKT